MTFEQILAVVDQLPPFDQQRLVVHLQIQANPYPDRTRILAEVARRYESRLYDESLPSLYGIEADPPLDLGEDTLLQWIHESATEWEKELDEYDTTPI